ncbi:MCE family protein [Mycolicibacterium sp. XJ879]
MLTALLIAGGVVLIGSNMTMSRTHIVAYFDNSNGIYPGDDVVLLGVPVGSITRIEPQPERVKIEFWVDDRYPIPADASAVILSPQLITSRAIQLTPAYTGGPKMADNSVIDLDRTAVPVEWDDFRDQLERLTDYLEPTESGGVSPLGSLIDTAANNLSGQGTSIRETIIELSGALSALGDHSGDVFSTIRNLSTLVSALRSSTDLMAQLNGNLASVTGLLANDPAEVARAIEDVNTAAGDVTAFLTEQRDAVGTAADKLTSISTAVVDQLDDIEQVLHIGPTTLQNVINVYEPAHASLTGAAVVNHFANPISFLCGAVQAASRMGFEQSAKLCVQYLAPIIKNRQYNFPPIGLNPIVGATARPNEVTYSEDWLRPDHRPTPAAPADPADGLTGILMPSGGER